MTSNATLLDQKTKLQNWRPELTQELELTDEAWECWAGIGLHQGAASHDGVRLPTALHANAAVIR